MVEYSDKRVLTIRGNLAVLNLKALLNCLSMTQSRIRDFLHVSKKYPDRPIEEFRAWLAELHTELRFLNEQSISSIETWSDVIEEANIRTEISKLEELNKSLTVLQVEKESLQRQLTETRNTSGAGIGQLKEQLQKTQEELKKATGELESERARIDRGVLSGIGSMSPSRLRGLSSRTSNLSSEYSCAECGNRFTENTCQAPAGIEVPLCDECRFRMVTSAQTPPESED